MECIKWLNFMLVSYWKKKEIIWSFTLFSYFVHSIFTVKFCVTDFYFCVISSLLLLLVCWIFFFKTHMHTIFTTDSSFFFPSSLGSLTLSCLCYFFASTVKRITSFFTRDMSHALVYVLYSHIPFFFSAEHIILQMQKVMAQVYFFFRCCCHSY